MTHSPIPRSYIFPVSAKTPEGLYEAIERNIDLLSDSESGDSYTVQQICRTAGVTQEHHPLRLTVVGFSKEQLAHELDSLLQNPIPSFTKNFNEINPPVFMFSGLGSLWPGMARDLLDHQPEFRRILIQCDRILHDLSGWSLLQVLTDDEETSLMKQTAYAQPLLFALQAGLVALWDSWGIKPSAVVGHSAGEIAAAYTAGVLDLETSMSVAFHRGRLMDCESSRGSMVVVAMAIEDIETLLPCYSDQIEIAAVNGPQSFTLSGDQVAISQLINQLKIKHIPVKRLDIEYAYHSSKMDPIKSELLLSLEHIRPSLADKKLYSTVTGHLSLGLDWDANYWWQNSRQRVNFSSAINELIASGHSIFLEIGPHVSLQRSVKDCLMVCQSDGIVLGSLKKEEPDQNVIFASLGQLYCQGLNPNWNAVYSEDLHQN